MLFLGFPGFEYTHVPQSPILAIEHPAYYTPTTLLHPQTPSPFPPLPRLPNNPQPTERLDDVSGRVFQCFTQPLPVIS